MKGELAAMMARHARAGRIEAIYTRPERRGDVVSRDAVMLGPDGPDGDHAPQGKRAVTLIQAEHLAVVAALLGRDDVDPALLRRNIVLSGINILALRHAQVRLGEAVIEVTGPCPPCSRMEEVLGHGGYSAMRGHGGVYAAVVTPGRIALGDAVERV